MIPKYYLYLNLSVSDPIGNHYQFRFPAEDSFAGIEDGTDQIQTIVDDGQNDFINKTSFIIREGLCGTPEYVSIESSAFPGKFWRHTSSNVKLQDRGNDDLFMKDACWRISKDNCNLNQNANAVSFYSFNYQDQLITKCGNHLKLEADSGNKCGSSENVCWIMEHKHGLLETFIKSNQIDLNQCIKGQLLIFILSTLCQLWTQLGHLGAPGTVAAKHAVEG